jgi:hypothetical protein
MKIDKNTQYQVTLFHNNCKTNQDIVIMKGLTVREAIEQGYYCKYCGCLIKLTDANEVPYSIW